MTIELTDLHVNVKSESDFRGVLGVEQAIQPGPLSIRVAYRLAATNATDEQLRRSWSEPGVDKEQGKDRLTVSGRLPS